MAKRGVLVGNTFYKTKKEVLERLQKIFYGYGLFEKISEETAKDDFCFLLGVLKNHPCVDEKMGCGIDYFYIGLNPLIPNRRMPCLRRLDGTEEDWSFIKCLGNMKKQEEALPLLKAPVEHRKAEEKEKNMSQLPEGTIALNCWRIQRDARKNYVTLFDTEGTMYKYITVDGCHFSEGRFYLVTAKYVKEKVSSNGKSYKALHGVFIVARISREEYKNNRYDVPLRAIGEVVCWTHGNQQMEGVITAIECDEDEEGSFLYHVRSNSPYTLLDMITENQIVQREEINIAS